MRLSGAVVAFAGFSGIAMAPLVSFAQYPGSAGNFSDGAFGAASSASSGSAGTAESMGGGGSSVSSASSSETVSETSYDGNAADGHNGFGGKPATAVLSKKTIRKQALIRQFRVEFAQTLIFHTANQHPLDPLTADIYLDQFSKELDAGIERQADLNSLGRDLGLMRDALDDRLDRMIAIYGGGRPQRDGFSKIASVGGSASALRMEVQKLKLKHELLAFGQYSLQAMGYYVE